MMETNLSEHLTIREVLHSDTAIRLGIANDFDTEEHFENMKLLATHVFEPARKFINEPIYVTSGYRSKELNKAVGGVAGSHHTTGNALDISLKNKKDNWKLFGFIRHRLLFDQLIWEKGNDKSPQWIHISLKKEVNRCEVLRYDGKKYWHI